MTDTATIAETLRRLEQRVVELEKHSHEPFDFTHLIARLEALEARATLDERERVYERVLHLTENTVIGGMVLDSEGRAIVRRLREEDARNG